MSNHRACRETAAFLTPLLIAVPVFGQPESPKTTTADKPESARQTRVDAEGVPLPEGAIARLGSSRFRFGEYPYFPPVFSFDGRPVGVGRPGGGAGVDRVASA